MRYGSDLVVGWLVDAGLSQVALNPGATIRGLHDSLVRDERLEPVLALHEEIAVAMAHGYAKASGQPLAVFVHDLVGLQHAAMALFNAYVDRVPMLVLGGTGPQDETCRRPWLDWIHTSTAHTNIARDLVKAVFEPASLVGLRDTLARALRTATSPPQGPVYVAVDVALQEHPVDAELGPLTRLTPFLPRPAPDEVDHAASLLGHAERPVLVVDRPVPGACDGIVRVAEATGAAVVDLGGGFGFPTAHWANQSHARAETLAEADVVLTLEVRDLAWAVGEVDMGTRQTRRLTGQDTKMVAVGCGELRDMSALIPEQLVPGASYLTADAATFVVELHARLDECHTNVAARRTELSGRHDAARERRLAIVEEHASDVPVHPSELTRLVHTAIKDGPWLLANGLVQGWPQLWDGPAGAFLGRSGGEGLGYGLPASLGAALACRDTETLVVDLQADGDLMYTSSALWTAAHYRLPLLVVMHDNGTYGKDELHQLEMARLRGRSNARSHVGIRLDDPHIDFALLARAQGVQGFGPVDEPNAAARVLEQAVRVVREERRPVLVDIRCSA